MKPNTNRTDISHLRPETIKSLLAEEHTVRICHASVSKKIKTTKHMSRRQQNHLFDRIGNLSKKIRLIDAIHESQATIN